ncbi:SHOCT domain-containing protein [Haladaptatus pallidirubidus]|uniref:SHOCT domain-containing protein n=1 Tax=Haladaptatus pallidirubidus TaxID=1008152 RepID=A0AAV3UND2_9EURY|nr:SHOCT domain-containing protein [Haladaptatus pallidirubidus]
MSDTPRERLYEKATEITSTVVTGFWLVALITGQDWWLAAMLLGYMVIVPVVALLFEDEKADESWWDAMWNDDWWDDMWDWSGGSGKSTKSEDSAEATEPNNRDALETLRNRYAHGELTDDQFERKLERLMETETIEDVEDRFRAEERERLRERE